MVGKMETEKNMAKKISKSVAILDLIASKPGGMRFTDIQRALWEMTYPDRPFTRELRGYWCTNLLGGTYYHRGLLRFYCVKDKSGKWVRNETSHNGKPWVQVNHNFWYRNQNYNF